MLRSLGAGGVNVLVRSASRTPVVGRMSGSTPRPVAARAGSGPPGGLEEGGHHDLFLLQTPVRRRGLNHVAFTVRDIHEVFGGGLHVSRCGWKTQIGPGRHPISSAYFWYVHNPAGGLAEYFADEDYCTADWKARAWERSGPNFAEWAIAGGIDGETRRQTGGPG